MIINEKYMKEFGIFPENYQMTEVMQYVPIAESIWIKPVLGDALFDEIQEQIDNDELSEENATLLVDGSVWRYLAMATALEMYPLLWAHLSEVSVTKGKSENSDPLTLKETAYVEQHIRRQVEVLKEEVIKFLNTYCNQYPLFVNSECCTCCCGDKLGLKKPNKMSQVYSPRRKRTDIK